MSRLIVLLALLVLIVIALDPNARQKAATMVQNLEHRLNNKVVVTTPSVSDSDSDNAVTPVPTVSPVATATAENDNKVIPNTGNDTNKQPIIQVNWDALGEALRRFWDSLRNIKINLNPQDNK